MLRIGIIKSMIQIVALEDDEHFLTLLRRELKARRIQNELVVYTTVKTAEAASAVIVSADVILLDYYAPDGSFHAALPQSTTAPIIAISTAFSKNEAARKKYKSVRVQSKLDGSMDTAAMRIVDEIVQATT